VSAQTLKSCTFLSFASWMFAAASSTHISSPCFAESKALWNLGQQ
jgi:hypothetical protein